MLRISAIAFLVVLLTGCIKTSEREEKDNCGCTAPCVYLSINEFKNDPNTCSTGASIKEYKWEGKTVHVYDGGICIADGQAIVKDTNCKVLGYLGGIAGNSTIEGKEWSTAVYIRTIWSN